MFSPLTGALLRQANENLRITSQTKVIVTLNSGVTKYCHRLTRNDFENTVPQIRHIYDFVYQGFVYKRFYNHDQTLPAYPLIACTKDLLCSNFKPDHMWIRLSIETLNDDHANNPSIVTFKTVGSFLHYLVHSNETSKRYRKLVEKYPKLIEIVSWINQHHSQTLMDDGSFWGVSFWNLSSDINCDHEKDTEIRILQQCDNDVLCLQFGVEILSFQTILNMFHWDHDHVNYDTNISSDCSLSLDLFLNNVNLQRTMKQLQSLMEHTSMNEEAGVLELMMTVHDIACFFYDLCNTEAPIRILSGCCFTMSE